MTNAEAVYLLTNEKNYMENHGGDAQVEALEMAIKAIEQEPCTDAISRQAVLDEMYKRKADGDAITAGFIKNLQAVTPQPKMGHWIYDDKCYEHGHCSECGYGKVDLVNGEPHNFCRRCGAKMVEPRESEEEKW